MGLDGVRADVVMVRTPDAGRQRQAGSSPSHAPAHNNGAHALPATGWPSGTSLRLPAVPRGDGAPRDGGTPRDAAARSLAAAAVSPHARRAGPVDGPCEDGDGPDLQAADVGRDLSRDAER
jgi:hypothetical protein